MRKSFYTVTYETTDEFDNGQAPGWAVRDHGVRLDWPLLSTRAEADAAVVGFKQADRELYAEERSERLIGA